MSTPLGNTLAAARRERGWSLRQAEAETGIRNAHISQIETGAIERPDPNILWSLAVAYGLDFDEIMRLAGHVKAGGTGDAHKYRAQVAWRALGDLTAEEVEEVLRFMDGLRKGTGDDPARRRDQ